MKKQKALELKKRMKVPFPAYQLPNQERVIVCSCLTPLKRQRQLNKYRAGIYTSVCKRESERERKKEKETEIKATD